jgi:hypothetical protein
MKNVYINSVLISRFYLQTIHKTKNTTKIIIIKIKKKVKKYKDKERKIIPFNMLKTTIKTIKIQWQTQMICRRRREGGGEKKWEEPRKTEPRRGGRFYNAVLLTELPTKHRIIFFRRWHWILSVISVGIFWILH